MTNDSEDKAYQECDAYLRELHKQVSAKEPIPLSVVFTYQGYAGMSYLSECGDYYHGRVLYLDSDVVTFWGRNVEEAELAFQDSVDDYLEWCAEEDTIELDIPTTANP